MFGMDGAPEFVGMANRALGIAIPFMGLAVLLDARRRAPSPLHRWFGWLVATYGLMAAGAAVLHLAPLAGVSEDAKNWALLLSALFSDGTMLLAAYYLWVDRNDIKLDIGMLATLGFVPVVLGLVIALSQQHPNIYALERFAATSGILAITAACVSMACVVRSRMMVFFCVMIVMTWGLSNVLQWALVNGLQWGNAGDLERYIRFFLRVGGLGFAVAAASLASNPKFGSPSKKLAKRDADNVQTERPDSLRVM